MTLRRHIGTILLAALWALFPGCDGSTPDEPPLDCTDLPSAPLEINQLEEGPMETWPTGYHDVAFDRTGWIAGYNRSALVRAHRSLPREVVSTALDNVEGMEYLPDGRLVVAAAQGVVAITPDGAVVPLAPDLTDGFSVVLGPDGMIYVGNNDRIHRIDPKTGATVRHFDFRDHPAFSGCQDDCPRARVLNFSPDRTKMYVGTFGSEVYAVDVDRDLTPVGEPTHFASLPNAQYQDGLAVDRCGNLFIPVWPDKLYRITPDGTRTTYHLWSDMDFYGHGLKWGPGVGGFRRDALYLPQPWNDSTGESTYTVVEVVVGVPGKLPGPAWSPAGDPHELTCAATGRRTRGPAAPAVLLLASLAPALRRRRQSALSRAT